jgi:alkanesulfonate monooxygenase SsuD/methylene tetrahydromethanopterin reductase-like flavin-dependent oxidoreductase (luciferase family)
MREEIELLVAPYERRGAWSDEAIRVMRACWREKRTVFAGEFFRFDPVGCYPKPRAGTIPIWIGGHTPRALRRTAELGDGWHAAFADASTLRQGMRTLAEECRRRGRDPAALTVSLRMGLPARRRPDELRAELDVLRDLGVAHVILESRARDLTEMVALYERFAEALN